MWNSKLSNFLQQLFLDKQSYLNIFYGFVTMLLGCLYLVPFLFLFSGPLALSGGPPIWFALFLFLLTLLLSQPIVSFERFMIRAWLGLQIPAPAKEEGIGTWKRLRIAIAKGMSWKHLLYIYCKAIVGTLTVAFLLSLFVATGIIFFGSLVYVIAGVIDVLLQQHLVAAMRLEQVQFTFIVVQVMPFAGISSLFWPLAFIRLLGTAIAGMLLLIGTFYLNNLLINVWKRFAFFTLIASKRDLQLLEARELAAQERQRAALADQKRRELITNVSHELRTPVASIQGHIEALLHADKEAETTSSAPDVLHQYLDIVYRESQQLGTLVDDLLVLSRAETDTLHLQIESVDAAEIVTQVYQALMPLARRERQITLLQEIDADVPTILADRQRLTQVLLNLVRNAITNTLDGGIVSITLQKADDSCVALQVADTGIGIPVEEQEHIFERFYRADASRSRSSGGAGLGLAIVHEFVLAMKGSITVESRVGEGSTFRVLLPIAR